MIYDKINNKLISNIKSNYKISILTSVGVDRLFSTAGAVDVTGSYIQTVNNSAKGHFL